MADVLVLVIAVNVLQHLPHLVGNGGFGAGHERGPAFVRHLGEEVGGGAEVADVNPNLDCIVRTPRRVVSHSVARVINQRLHHLHRLSEEVGNGGFGAGRGGGRVPVTAIEAVLKSRPPNDAEGPPSSCELAIVTDPKEMRPVLRRACNVEPRAGGGGGALLRRVFLHAHGGVVVHGALTSGSITSRRSKRRRFREARNWRKIRGRLRRGRAQRQPKTKTP